MELGNQLRHWGDELRVIADRGLAWSSGDPYHRERYQHVRRVAAALFAAADLRPAEVIEREVFRALTHLAPVPCGDAAVFNEREEILLIRRSDDRLWAMPGGMLDPGETPAEGICREAREETGVEVEALALIGVYDSRLCETRSSLQLYQLVFQCRPLGPPGEPATPHEVIDVGWFAEPDLPALSPGHTVRVPDAFAFVRRGGAAIFDRP